MRPLSLLVSGMDRRPISDLSLRGKKIPFLVPKRCGGESFDQELSLPDAHCV